MMAATRARTDRGFQVVYFQDRYGAECQLQQSSLADFTQPGASAVWLGLEGHRMHLDLERVQWLMAELQHWVETCEFRTEDDLNGVKTASTDTDKGGGN